MLLNVFKEENVDELENVLEQDFEDPKFNNYLDDQPGSSYNDDGRRCKIIIKNVSRYYSTKAIRNLCGEFGVCSIVQGPPPIDGRASYYFVTFGQLE